MKLTTYLHLVPRIMRRAVTPPLRLHDVVGDAVGLIMRQCSILIAVMTVRGKKTDYGVN